MMLFALLTLGLVSLPQVDTQDEAQARAVVERFCRLDADGAALEGDKRAFREMSALVTGERGSGGATVILVSGFRVGDARREGSAITVRVVYHEVGTIGSDWVLHARERESEWTFSQVQTSSGWRIDLPTVPMNPRVLPHALVRRLEALVPDDKKTAAGSGPGTSLRERMVASMAELKELARRVEPGAKKN